MTVNGIDHKFYATRSEQRFNDNHDEKTGQFTGAGEQPGKQLDYYSISGSQKIIDSGKRCTEEKNNG